MKRLIITSLFAAILLGAVIQAGPAYADTGPKPTMDFQLSFESGVDESVIISGILFECNESDCSDAAPLEELGPQGLYCEAQSCRATGYGFAPYLILELEFSDGVTRRSNIFEQVDFDSSYTVYVRAGDLAIEPGTRPGMLPAWQMALLACVCGLAGLGAIVGLVLFLRRRARA